MTEPEWKDYSDPKPMLDHVHGLAFIDEKLRLIAVACCQNVRNLLIDEQFPRAVEVAERHAGGLASDGEVNAFRNSSRSQYPLLLESAIDAARSTTEACVTAARIGAWGPVLNPRQFPEQPGSAVSDHFEHAAAVRIPQVPVSRNAQAVSFGNRRQPVSTGDIDPTWLTPNTIALAKTIYQHRAFAGMPSLGDALEQAGCDILASSVIVGRKPSTFGVAGSSIRFWDRVRTRKGRGAARRLSIQNASGRLRIVMLEPCGVSSY